VHLTHARTVANGQGAPRCQASLTSPTLNGTEARF